jgi:prolyl 4-hydroxylase|tara:strand:+ start:3991 stop:4626 length:636 start_codon:yes stop_codon:yes gene_type:complete
MKAHSINKKNNFIAGWYLDNLQVCDDLIKTFEGAKKSPGKLGPNREVIKKDKDSTDIAFRPTDPHPVAQTYLKELGLVAEAYKKLYPWCSRQHATWGLVETINIQRYHPTQGYHIYHFERGDGLSTSARHLTFMTYLNTLKDGGETEFYHQKFRAKPRKGLTLIWPGDWTHTHRGITSRTETKYIITGWYSYRESGSTPNHQLAFPKGKVV